MFHMSHEQFYRETPKRIISMMNAHKSINSPSDQQNKETGTNKPPVKQRITHLGNFLMSKV